VACPQVLEISSVDHQSFSFGVGFSLCWFTGGLFLCLTSFLWGKVSDPSASSLLSECCDGLLIFFNFAVSFDFGCCSLAQEMSFVDHYLPYFRQQLFTCPLCALLPFQSLFTESLHRDQLLALPPSSSDLSAPCPLCCVFLFSSLFIIQGFFCVGDGGVSLPRELCWFIPGVAVGIPHRLFAHQAGLELTSGSAEALLLCQCNVVWRSFVWAGSSRCWSS
jgi:hypothetical protein